MERTEKGTEATPAGAAGAGVAPPKRDASAWIRRALATVWSVIKAVVHRADRHAVMSRASNFAYSAFIGTVPVLFVLVSVIGLLGSPQAYNDLLDEFSAQIPDALESVLRSALTAASSNQSSAVLFLILGILGGMWQAGNVMGVVLEGLRTAQGIPGPPWVRGKLHALGAAAFAGLGAIVVTLAMVGSARAAKGFTRLIGGGPRASEIAQSGVLWTGRILLGVGVFALYWFVPRARTPRFLAVLIGTLFTAGSWLAATSLFSLYLDNFSRYNVVYGSLGAIVVYLTFLWITGLLVLLGGEVVAELESRRKPAGGERPAA